MEEEDEEGVKRVGEGVAELALSIREAGVWGPVNKALFLESGLFLLRVDSPTRTFGCFSRGTC